MAVLPVLLADVVSAPLDQHKPILPPKVTSSVSSLVKFFTTLFSKVLYHFWTKRKSCLPWQWTQPVTLLMVLCLTLFSSYVNSVIFQLFILLNYMWSSQEQRLHLFFFIYSTFITLYLAQGHIYSKYLINVLLLSIKVLWFWIKFANKQKWGIFPHVCIYTHIWI